MKDSSLIDEIVIGRVDPFIYAFTTGTIPDYLKIGDTYRPVVIRLKEWKEYFPDLKKQFEQSAKVAEDVYFRDFSIHYFLENEKKLIRLLEKELPHGVYYSKEFFKGASVDDIDEAIKDIMKDYQNNGGKYQFYSTDNRLPETYTYARNENYEPRPNQAETIEAFKKAINAGRTNLLMYAVMRFGKSFTSMCCAIEMNANIVVIVSAKADVKGEWKKTIESHVKFESYKFIDSDDLLSDDNIVKNALLDNKKVAIFLTLQDLQGTEIKDKHKEIFSNQIDLLIIDETHFGARAEKYGLVLRELGKSAVKAIQNKNDADDFVETVEAEQQINKVLNARIKLHLSGTPYRILMGGEFEKEDIIAFCQFTDIVKEQENWDKTHVLNDDTKEWDNPYFGFPQMIRFAFNPNESTRQRIKELKESGVSFAFSALFKPKSIKKSDDGSHQHFTYEPEILDLLEVIDGSKDDDELFGFLDYDKIKMGNMCRHIVMVLPYCASCDAMELLIQNNLDKFKNLNSYEILNISGLNVQKKLDTPEKIKNHIHSCETNSKKTLTLTVNRMLTGSTVEEWDTMLFLKDTASPQEYDQAIFRLQNQYVKKMIDDKGDVIKLNMKPQTLLVDFMPARMFTMQEQKAQIYNVNVDKAGNSKLQERLQEELRISPIIVVNKDKMVQVKAVDILEAVSEYSKSRGIAEEVLELPVDLSLMNIEVIRKAIERENELGSKAGLSIRTADGEENELDINNEDNEIEDTETPDNDDTNDIDNNDKSNDEKKADPVKQFRSYYARILFFAFLTKDTVISLENIISMMATADNARIAKHIGISKQVLENIHNHINWYVLRKLDYEISNKNKLSKDTAIHPLKRAAVALQKFGKLGESEVITPKNICDKMIALVPDDGFTSAVENGHKILDIAGKAGEFALAICERYLNLGFNIERIKDTIYTIPTSGLTYEFTRMVYEILGLNVNNIAENFNAYSLLQIKDEHNKVDYKRICAILSQNKPFNKITISDKITEGDKKMIFEAVVGNPPYQQVTAKQQSETNGQATRTNIFQHFQLISEHMAVNATSLIYPGARWMHRSGKGMEQFGLQQINDTKLVSVDFWPDPSEIFDDVGIADGITIVQKSIRKTTQGFVYTYHKDGGACSIQLNPPGNNLIALNPIHDSIVAKIEDFVKKYKIKYAYDRILARSLFGIESDFVEKNPTKIQLLNKKEPKDIDYQHEIKLLANDKAGKAGKSTWYIADKNVIQVNQQYINEWQVVVSSANAGGQKRDSQLEIIDNHSAFGRSRVALGSFKTEAEAKNFFNFTRTALIRFMYLMTDEALTSLGKRVPDVLDYTAKNQFLDFSKNLDDQLYKLVGLNAEEIKVIESTVRPVE